MADYGAIHRHDDQLNGEGARGGRAGRIGAKRPRNRVCLACCAVFFCSSMCLVVLVIVLPTAVTSITGVLRQQFQTRFYAPEETQLTNIPTFFCEGVSLSANTEATLYLLPENPPLSSYKPLAFSYVRQDRVNPYLQMYLHPNSIISVLVCVPDFSGNTYKVYIFRGLNNLADFKKNPKSVQRYYLQRSEVTRRCSNGAAQHVAFDVKEGDNYVVAFIAATSIYFDLNTTVLFNRTEYSIDQLNGPYPNCTFQSSLSPCDLGVPLGSTTNALVVAAFPPDWDNQTYNEVHLDCDSRAWSYVVITVVPFTVILVICIAGAIGSAISSKCGQTIFNPVKKTLHVEPPAPGLPEGVQPFIPH